MFSLSGTLSRIATRFEDRNVVFFKRTGARDAQAVRRTQKFLVLNFDSAGWPVSEKPNTVNPKYLNSRKSTQNSQEIKFLGTPKHAR